MTSTRRSILTLAITLFAVGIWATSTPALANAEIERAELARLIHELEQLERVIQQAEASADSTQRIHFQYGWLRNDLERVKAGIREYLETVPLAPKTITPLAGDYIR